jgi:hypothetical protein
VVLGAVSRHRLVLLYAMSHQAAMFYRGAEQRRDVPLYTCPHYTDARFRQAQTVFGGEQDELHYDYSDRLFQWNPQKSADAVKAADESGAVKRSADWYESYLSAYCDKPVELKHVLAGCNWATGYPYTVFGYAFKEQNPQRAEKA